MEQLKIDQTKVKTITNYARHTGQTRQNVHALIKKGALKTVKIDGVVFVDLR